ncbi:MAG: ABC transporter substrate-binding protein, partial [Christensenellales bacterium]
EPNAMNFHFNLTSVDPVKAPYLHSVDFRRALSIGMDRETVIATFYTVGPYSSKVAQTSFLEGSAHYDEEWATQYTQFDPDEANAMLDALGMTEYDANGYRMTANGEEFDLVILCPSYDVQWIEVAEMVASQWRENLKVNVIANEVDPSLWGERTQSNDFDITNLTGSDGFLYVSTGAVDSWTGYNAYGWGTRFMPGAYLEEGDKAFEPTENMARLWELGNLIINEVDFDERDKQIAEVIQIRKDDLSAIGIGRRLPAINIIKNNFRNVENLNQDWAFGFCGSSRGDGYWIQAD